MRPRTFLLAAALLLPAAVQAQPVRGLYINIGAGAGFLGDLTSADQATKLDTDAGPIGLIDVGWGWGNGLRAAIEGSYRANGIAAISTQRQGGNLVPLTNENGSIRTYAFMANVAYDLPVHVPTLPVQPYIGAGIGYGWLDLGDAGVSFFGIARADIPVDRTSADTGLRVNGALPSAATHDGFIEQANTILFGVLYALETH